MRNKIPLFFALFLGFIVSACAQTNSGVDRLPAIGIPVHVLNKDDIGRTVIVESGDWLEFELPVSDGSSVWKARVEDSLKLVKSSEIVRRNTEAGLVQVLRFQTRSAGSVKVDFEPVAGAPPERSLSFSIDIR